MRDGLSLLDQVLSFGEGRVTPERVREVLGLIADDLYGEMLRLVAERDAKAVFPLVDRLAEAGADFGEFVAGAAETLRAVLQVSLGGEPEGLTDGMFALVKQYSARLSAPDIVRLLTILGGMEVQVRQSGHPRLVVELLLLRWAMADRTVEIGEVLNALGSGERGVVRGGSPGNATPPMELRDVASAQPVPLPTPHSPQKGPLTASRASSSLALHRRAGAGVESDAGDDAGRRAGRRGERRHGDLGRRGPRRRAGAQEGRDRETDWGVGGGTGQSHSWGRGTGDGGRGRDRPTATVRESFRGRPP